MRFALLGDHPDGLAMARALVESGRHQLGSYTGSLQGSEKLGQHGITVSPVRDLEEVLADPAIEAVIVASRPDLRAQHLRRVLQSERHVLCVHPVDDTPDSAYEAALIQGDTGCVLLPLLPHALHPAIGRLAEQIRNGIAGPPTLIEFVCHSRQQVLIETSSATKPSVPAWDVLRALGGEVAELGAFSRNEELLSEDSLLLSGRLEQGGLFQAVYLPGQKSELIRISVTSDSLLATLVFHLGLQGDALMQLDDKNGSHREEHFEAWTGWAKLVELFESALALPNRRATEPAQPRVNAVAGLSWQTEIRCLELDDAARRSVHRRRVSTLEYPEASEEVGFKGTMTLVGCGIIWAIILMLILSVWVPWVGWLIIPSLVFFLGLQVLQWLVPKDSPEKSEAADVREP